MHSGYLYAVISGNPERRYRAESLRMGCAGVRKGRSGKNAPLLLISALEGYRLLSETKDLAEHNATIPGF